MKKFFTGLAAAGLLFGALSPSQAVFTQFAVVNPIDSVNLPYKFDNATQVFSHGPVDVNFKFLIAPLSGLGDIPATLTFSALPTVLPFVPPDTQPLAPFEFTIKRNSNGDILLHGIALSGDLRSTSAQTAILVSDTGAGLVMNSDYIPFIGDPQAAAWSFSKVLDVGAGAPGPFHAGPNGFLVDFLFAGNGNFSADVGVPEPGSVALLMGLGIGSLTLIRRRRRK